jgi:tripartite-type tricarboxylate transporter receptor subunit TctC
VMGKVPNAILTNSPKLKDVKTVADFVAYAKAHPGVLNSGTQGVGTTSHLTSELFAQMAGVKFQHVHYRGSAPAVQDLVAGTMDVAFDNIGAAGALIRAGTIRALGVATEKPVESLPGVPVVKDTVPGFVVVTWFALVAPPKVPQPIVDKLNADINEALRDPDVKKRLGNLSAEVAGGSLAETAAFFKSEISTWHEVIKKANVKLDQ